jgi:hypothetical protein
MATAAVEPALTGKIQPIKFVPISAESEVMPANFSTVDVAMPMECAWLPFPGLFVESPPLFLGGFGEPVLNGQSFPLPTESSAGGVELEGEQLIERMRMLHCVETELMLQMEARFGEPVFSPPLPVPFGWRPGPEDVVPWPKPNVWKHAPARQKVFVGGLTSKTTGDDLREYFAKFGDVRTTDVLIDHATGRSRGFGFVEFVDHIPDGVVDVDHLIDGRKCGARSYAGPRTHGTGKQYKQRGPKKGNPNRAENLAGGM